MRVDFSQPGMAKSPASALHRSPAPSTASSSAGDVAASYEAALAELDQLVERMESAQLPLDALLDAHRRGAELLAYCRSRLDAVQQQVQVLEEGQLQAWPGGGAAPVPGAA